MLFHPNLNICPCIANNVVLFNKACNYLKNGFIVLQDLQKLTFELKCLNAILIAADQFYDERGTADTTFLKQERQILTLM